MRASRQEPVVVFGPLHPIHQVRRPADREAPGVGDPLTYQFLASTWRRVAPKAGFPGYSRAIHAPPRVQDHVALWLYNNGGRSAWNGTGC